MNAKNGNISPERPPRGLSFAEEFCGDHPGTLPADVDAVIDAAVQEIAPSRSREKLERAVRRLLAFEMRRRHPLSRAATAGALP